MLFEPKYRIKQEIILFQSVTGELTCRLSLLRRTAGLQGPSQGTKHSVKPVV